MSIGDDERVRIVPQGIPRSTHSRGNAPGVEIRYPEPDDRPSYGKYTQAFTVGRGEDCDIRLLTPGVSRHHVEIFPQDGAWWARDLKSSNGTLVNGRPIDHLPPAARRYRHPGARPGRTADPGYGSATHSDSGPGRKPPVPGGHISALSECRVRDTGGGAYHADPPGF